MNFDSFDQQLRSLENRLNQRVNIQLDRALNNRLLNNKHYHNLLNNNFSGQGRGIPKRPVLVNWTFLEKLCGTTHAKAARAKLATPSPLKSLQTLSRYIERAIVTPTNPPQPAPSEPSSEEAAMTKDTFVLHDGVSRRTRQRYQAHLNGGCNTKCRFCRKASNVDAGVAVKVQERAPVAAITALPTAAGVLAGAVADNYHKVVKPVARKRAVVEVNQAAFVAGMMVYHQFDHYPCILLEETAPGVWTIQTKDGSKEELVKAAILTPAMPALYLRAWALLKAAVSTLLYKDVEVQTDQGLIEQRKFRGSLFAAMILAAVLTIAIRYVVITTP